MCRLRRLLAVFAVATGIALAQDPYFVGVGDLPGGYYISFARSMSADGRWVAGVSTGQPFGGGDYPFIWTLESGMQPLLPSNDLRGGNAEDVSFGGRAVVGGGSMERHGGAYRWTPDEGVHFLGYLPGGEYQSNAEAVSWDGCTVAGWSKSSNALTVEAYRWTAESGMVSIGDLPGGHYVSNAQDISADGNVIVGFSVSSNGTEAFRWTPETGMVGLGDLPGGTFDSMALDVSGDGRVVTGSAAGDSGYGSTFWWREDTGMIEIPSPGEQWQTLNLKACSYDGYVVVGEWQAKAVIWTHETGVRILRDVLVNEYGLDLSEWRYVISAESISADGRTICGYGESIRGTEGWVAYLGLPPCLGDLNHDNAVNLVDLVTLLIHFGDTLAGPTEGDLDRDADVDLADLTVLLAGYGRVCD